MKKKFFKSKMGLIFSGFYLSSVGLALIIDLTAPTDPDNGVWVLFLALPWSAIVLGVVQIHDLKLYPLTGYVLIASSVLINAVIAYVLGFMVSKATEWTE